MSKPIAVSLSVEVELNAEQIGLSCRNEQDIARFIVGIEENHGEMGLTELLIAHFKALEAELLKSGDLSAPVEPKLV